MISLGLRECWCHTPSQVPGSWTVVTSNLDSFAILIIRDPVLACSLFTARGIFESFYLERSKCINRHNGFLAIELRYRPFSMIDAAIRSYWPARSVDRGCQRSSSVSRVRCCLLSTLTTICCVTAEYHLVSTVSCILQKPHGNSKGTWYCPFIGKVV